MTEKDYNIVEHLRLQLEQAVMAAESGSLAESLVVMAGELHFLALSYHVSLKKTL